MKANLKGIYQSQLGLTIVGGVLYSYLMPLRTISFLLGCFVITANLFLLNLLWSRVLSKKPIAFTLGLVITKYAGLGLILYVLASAKSVHLASLLVGVSTLIVSVLLFALRLRFREK